jgi:hypothetical protein
MAITRIEYELLKNISSLEIIKENPNILELGEANWYNDVDLNEFFLDIDYLVKDENEKSLLFSQLNKIIKESRPQMLFDIAKVFWHAFFRPSSLTAIDFDGTEHSSKQDLNYPLNLPLRYDMVTNIGTAEHVFNVAQFFKSVHDYTLPGGFMFHGLPFSGWVDHGFFNFNSTFYWDLAERNNYYLVFCMYTEISPLKIIPLENRDAVLNLAKNGGIGKNSLIHCLMKKNEIDSDFLLPIQGYYNSSISDEAVQAWHNLR